MSINEAQRRQVYADLERALGPDSAAVVMEQVFAVDRRDLARQSVIDARFALVDAQFVAVRGEMAELRGELKGEIAEVKGKIEALSGKVEGEARRLAAINAVSVVAASMATAGLVLAASRLA